MFSLESPRSPFNFSPKKRSPPRNLDLISRLFDETLLRRLKPLIATATATDRVLTLSWLSLAVDLLSSTHADAETLISLLSESRKENLKIPYLDASLKVLDVCNSISAEIVRLQEGRLLINFILHLLGSDEISAHKNLTKARNSLSDWKKCLYEATIPKRSLKDAAILIRELAEKLGDPPRGKITTVEKLVHRTVYTVEAMTVFVTGVLVAVLTGSSDRVRVRVSTEFIWGESFNSLESVVTKDLLGGEKKRFISDLDKVETRVTKVCEVMEGDVTGVELKGTVKELKTVTEAYTDGLDRLLDGVNRFFSTVLCTRDGLMENFKVQHLNLSPDTLKKR